MKGSFTQVPNDILSDPKLSAFAKVVYSIMLSKPLKWDFTIKRISEEMKESSKTVNKALKELREAGWVEYKRNSYKKTKYKINREVKYKKSINNSLIEVQEPKEGFLEEVLSEYPDYVINNILYKVLRNLLPVDTSNWKMSEEDVQLIEEKIKQSIWDTQTIEDQIISNLNRMKNNKLECRFGNLFLGIR